MKKRFAIYDAEEPEKQPGCNVLIYGLVDPRDGTLRYVGKTWRPLYRLAQHVKKPTQKNPGLRKWILKLRALEMGPRMVRLAWVKPRQWEIAERDQIAAWRLRGPLYNIAPGGDWKPDYARRRRRKRNRKEGFFWHTVEPPIKKVRQLPEEERRALEAVCTPPKQIPTRRILPELERRPEPSVPKGTPWAAQIRKIKKRHPALIG